MAPARWTGRALAGLALVLPLFALVGWYGNWHQLASLVPEGQVMVPNTVVSLLLLASSYLARDRFPRVAALTTLVVALFSLSVLVEQGTSLTMKPEKLLPGVDLHEHSPQMARATPLALLLISLALLAAQRRRERLVQLLGVLALLGGYVAVLGYVLGTSRLTTLGGLTSMALPTALSLCMLSVAVLLGSQGSPLTQLLADKGNAGRLVRSLLPVLLLVPPVVGWLRLEGQLHGFYDTRFGIGIQVTVMTVATTALLVRTALHVRRADASRAAALDRLSTVNEDLERLVEARTEELSAARARFEAAFASSPLGAVLTSLDGTVEEVNRLVPLLTGRPRTELVGLDVADLFDDDLTADDAELRAELLGGRSGSYFLERRLKRDGTPVWVQTSVALVRDDAGAQALIHQLEDITARRLAEDRAEHMALHDPLTDLPNRVLLMDRLRQALAHAARTRHGVGVLFIDLDRFKVVNDSLGHHVGDMVLKEVARRLSRTARTVDTVARLGGDEFVVLVTDVASADDVVKLADVLREVVSRPMSLAGLDTDVDASVGIAFGVGHEDPEVLLRHADQAMYSAKDRGRARAEVFDDDLRTLITQRLDTELALRGAVERGEVVTWFQPIVELETEQVVAAEALARWSRPGRGLVLPQEFIHVAEEVGLIKDVGTSVLHQALQQAAAVPGGPAVSINVSARQFVREDFRAVVEEALAESGLPPERLWLELTESALVEAFDVAARSFQELRHLGVRIAVDDFGTGFSSFSHLRRFPVDLLKIDKSFVADLTTSARDRAIVEGMVRMADALGVDMVGEGVETRQQRDLLRAIGCRYAQGFLYARPAPFLAPAGGPGVPAQGGQQDDRVEQGAT